MRYDPPRSDLARDSHAPELAEPTGMSVVLVVACGALVVCPALTAFTHGWDYALAVMVGAVLAVTLAGVAWRAFPTDRVVDRLAMALAGTLAAALFCAYAADWLDWRPLGIDDAIAGMTIGVVLLIAGPLRQALRHADRAPNAAGAALIALAFAPAAWSAFVSDVSLDLLPYALGDALVVLPGVGTALLVALAAFLFALQRGQYWTAITLSALAGLEVFLLVRYSGAQTVAAALAAGAAASSLLLVAGYAWVKSARKIPWTPACVLAWLAIATTAALAVDAAVIAYFTAAAGVTVWWLTYQRRGAPLVIQVSLRPGDVRRTALAGALGVTLCTQWVLFEVAALNYTGPMVLAGLRELGLYTVSDFTFSNALLADQYLWRDSASSSRRITATSPDKLVEASRYERDRWSGVDLAARQRAEEARNAKGYGIVLGPRVAAGFAVAYVYEGSPAHAAGVRRGDVIRAIDGIPIDDAGDETRAAPQTSDAMRLELARAGGEVREITLTKGGYARPAVTLARVIEDGGRRVGYVVLQDFLGTAEEEFANAAARLQEQGIDELVLDLRLNPGGRLVTALRIASVIGGSHVKGKTFVRVAHNERHRDRDRDLSFRLWRAKPLSLQRIFVITSEETCSASEALINGLAPHMPVVTVGTPTCGKPVGSSSVEYGAFAYSVITFRVTNARGEGDYYDGLRPTCAAEDDRAHELGDPADPSLAATLHYIRYGGCPPPASSAIL